MEVQEERRLWGSVVSEGVSIGNLFLLPCGELEEIPVVEIHGEEIQEEIRKYRRAIEASKLDLLLLKENLEEKETRGIIEAHIQMLDDPLMTTQIEKSIESEQKNAAAVFFSIIREYEKRFVKIKDLFFQQRIVDVLDLSQRVLAHLCEHNTFDVAEIPLGAIVFTKELSPSQIAAIQAPRIGAIITEQGGGSSHAALIARAKGVPYVSGIDLSTISKVFVERIIVDGRSGEVIVNPSFDTIAAYRKIQATFKAPYKISTRDLRHITKTKEGKIVHIYANVGSLADLDEMRVYNPKGIGLLRSEFFFLDTNVVLLSEEDQLYIYSQVFAKTKDLSVVMRVFDVGGDKQMDFFLEKSKELNPFLGCRGIRFLLKHPTVFRTQLRAIMRSVHQEDVRILLPLVSDIQEIQTAKEFVREVQKELLQQGVIQRKTPFSVGCMIEVPSMVILCEAVFQEVDFVSIGTNDLIQCTLGMDRGDSSVSEFFHLAHPSLIRMIKTIVTEGKKQKKPVAICGEIASNPRLIPLLLGLGLEEFSCSPRHIPLIKKVVRQCSFQETVELAERVLQMNSARAIEQALAAFLEA